MFLLFLVLFLAALSYPVAVKAEAGNYYLSMGEYLSGGMRITSLNGKYFAMMQTDGNFVIYQSDTQKALWHTNTYGGNYTSYRAMMQTDGNFVVYGIKKRCNDCFVECGNSCLRLRHISP